RGQVPCGQRLRPAHAGSVGRPGRVLPGPAPRQARSRGHRDARRRGRQPDAGPVQALLHRSVRRHAAAADGGDRECDVHGADGIPPPGLRAPGRSVYTVPAGRLLPEPRGDPDPELRRRRRGWVRRPRALPQGHARLPVPPAPGDRAEGGVRIAPPEVGRHLVSRSGAPGVVLLLLGALAMRPFTLALALLVLAMTAGTTTRADDRPPRLVLVVHAENKTGRLDKTTLRNIYLGLTTYWSNDTRIKPYNRIHDGAAGRLFFRDV